MADFNSSLPVRTESAGDVIAKLCDATVTSQQLAIDSSGLIGTKIHDSSGNSLNSTSNALDVFVSNTNVNVTATQGTAAAGTAGWPVTMGNVAEATAAWTSATTANTAVTLTVTNYSSVVVTLNQTTTITGGIVTFEVSDTTGFTNAYPILGLAPDTLATGLTYTLQDSVNKSFVFNVAGWAAFRVRLSTTISGTGTVNVGVAANAAGTTPTVAAEAVGSGGTVNQGTKGTNAQAWWVEIGDTTNGPVAVKPSSTPAATGDNSLVVALSPNSPVPAGSNTIGSVKLTDGTNTASITGAGEVKVDVTQPLPAGSNLIGNVNVFQGSAATSPANPIYVSNVAAGGTSVDSYQTTPTLAAGSSTTLDYTVTTGKTFYCQQLWATASGKIKVVLAFETAAGSGTFVTFWVGFNSTSEPNILIPLPPTKTQVSAAKIRVTITNEDKQAMDVYETLSGNEQ